MRQLVRYEVEPGLPVEAYLLKPTSRRQPCPGVAVSSEGGIATRFSNWDAPWYLGKEIRRDTFRHEHHELLAVFMPTRRPAAVAAARPQPVPRLGHPE
ncbi:MAG: hypothetical protein ACC645_24215, partial [Pirellulales bacterium]